MRFHRASVLAASIMAAATPLAAQDAAKPAPSVEGYLCTFAGKCEGNTTDTVAETRDAPATRGFRLARPAGEAATAGKPSSARVSRSSYVRPSTVRTTSPGRRQAWRAPSGPEGAGSRAAGVTATAAANIESLGQRRADLMIGFDLNSARISRQGLASARVFAQSLVRPELAGMRFRIEGHTDSRGSQALNTSLSAQRAQAVADFLASQGVDRSRLVTRGFGASVPLPGHAPADPANRRVEAELVR